MLRVWILFGHAITLGERRKSRSRVIEHVLTHVSQDAVRVLSLQFHDALECCPEVVIGDDLGGLRGLSPLLCLGGDVDGPL